MKKIKKFAAIVLGVATVSTALIGCSSDDSSAKLEQANPQEGSVRSLTSAPSFDYDIYGKTHNEFLDYLGQHPDFDTMSFEQSVNYGNTFRNDYFDFSEIQIDTKTLNNSIDDIMMSLTSEEGATNYMQRKGMITSEELVLAERLLGLFDNAVDVVKEEYKSIEDFEGEVIEFQNYVKNNYDVVYSKNEVSLGAKYLAASSVASHTYRFWVNAATDINSPYYRYLGDDYLLGNSNNRTVYRGKRPGLFKRIWDGIKIGSADVEGFLDNRNPNTGEFSLNRAIWMSAIASAEAKERRGY